MKYLDELFEYNKKIINKSNEVLYLLTNITINDGSLNIKVSQEELENNYDKYIELIYKYNDIRSKFRMSIAKIVVSEINELKDLVIVENKILNDINVLNIDEYLDRLDSFNNRYDSIIIDRVRERLMIRNISLSGNNIKGTDFFNNPSINGMEFDIHDVILTMIHIEVFKTLKSKLDNLETFSESDKCFRRDLYEYYERAKFNDFSYIPTFEVISLLYNTDMARIPSIDINRLMEHDSIDNDELDKFISTMAVDTIDLIASIEDSYLEEALKNTYEAFDYLFDIILFEVLLSYMDVSMLQEVSDYCKEVMNANNKINVSNISRLVKKKLKD